MLLESKNSDYLCLRYVLWVTKVRSFLVPIPIKYLTKHFLPGTGKSSLIEGISEIRVPRKAGVCTRCPIEINISEGAHPWKCEVYLHKVYFYEGSKFQNAGASRNRPLGPWTEQHAEDQHFATVSTKEEVGQILHWAQLATLNPGYPPESYKPAPDRRPNESLQVKFSPNVVRVKISGPGLPNLAFYDLPGVINVAESDKEGYLIKLVRNLVTKYLKDDNCITILATPMTADAAVSSAGEIIREVHAQGRTLGVLTKPDRLPPGEPLDQWISILGDRLYPLGYGYHVVKNNPDVSVDHATAREEEKEFFATEPAFSSELKDYKSKFGTLQLQNRLSKLLTDQIQTKLPRITAKILEKAATVDEELSKLPKPPAGNLPLLIHSKIIEFSRSIELHLDGGSPDRPFQTMWHALIQDFRKHLADSRPLLVLPSPPVDSSSAPAAISIESDTDDNGSENVCQPKPLSTKKRQNTSSPNTQPPKRKKLTEIPKHLNGAKAAPGLAMRFQLKDIQEMINAGHRGLPGQSDPRVCERMIRVSMLHWEKLMNQFLEDTKSLVDRLVADRVAESFSHWQSTALYSKILHICEAFLLRVLSHQRVAAARSHNMELHKAMTFDVEGMKQAREKAFASLYASRLKNRISIYLNDEEAMNGKRTTDQARNDKIAKTPIEKLGPDPYDQEINAMAVSTSQ